MAVMPATLPPPESIAQAIAAAIDAAPPRTIAGLVLLDGQRRAIATDELAHWIAARIDQPPLADARQLGLPL